MKALLRKNHWIYLMVVLAAVPALLLRDFTPDNELRYLCIADEALANGSLFCFSLGGQIYADKPPLYLWIVMAARWLHVNEMFFVGLFSLVPMLLCGRVMDRMAAPFLSERQRGGALLMLFSCGYFPALGLTLRMDMLMTLFILLAMERIWRMALEGATHGGSALLGFYVFMALFTKGPLGVAFPLLGSLAWLLWERKGWLWLRIWSWPAWLVLLGGCALWFGAVYCEGGPEYLDNLLFHQTVDRAHNAFHHARPFYYYAIAIWYVMAPWSLLMLYFAIKRRREAADSNAKRLCLSMLGVVFLLLSAISSKLQVYLLPAVPFAVYWLALVAREAAWLPKVARGFAITLYALVFVAGWLMPKYINPIIGYGAACAQVPKGAEIYVDRSVRRGENVAAYFPGQTVSIVDSSAPGFSLPKGTVLLKPSPTITKLTVYESNK